MEEYITDQIRKSEALSVMDLERFSFAWAMAALDWLSDKKNVDVRTAEFTTTWQNFITTLETKSARLANFNIHDMLKLPLTKRSFYQALRLVEQNT
jgi:hypothetical protein